MFHATPRIRLSVRSSSRVRPLITMTPTPHDRVLADRRTIVKWMARSAVAPAVNACAGALRTGSRPTPSRAAIRHSFIITDTAAGECRSPAEAPISLPSWPLRHCTPVQPSLAAALWVSRLHACSRTGARTSRSAPETCRPTPHRTLPAPSGRQRAWLTTTVVRRRGTSPTPPSAHAFSMGTAHSSRPCDDARFTARGDLVPQSRRRRCSV